MNTGYEETEMEAELRRMLRRRAADITDADVPLPGDGDLDRIYVTLPTAPAGGGPAAIAPARTKFRYRFLAIAAVSLTLAGGAVAALDRFQSEDEPAIRADTADGAVTAALPAPEAVAVRSPQTVEDLMASLPSEAAVGVAPPVFVDYDLAEPGPVAQAYLGHRLPDVPVTIAQATEQGDLTLFRWSYDMADVAATGTVLVRQQPGEPTPVVVLATTDGIGLSSVDRTATTLTLALESDIFQEGSMTLFVNEFDQQTTAADDDPGRTIDADGTLTDVSTPGDQPVTVRAQHIGGTSISLVELALPAVGFSQPCGTEPPVTIEVGDRLTAVTPGPSPQSSRAVLENQQVWHHQGDVVDVEILWPADPNQLAGITANDLGDGATWRSPASGEPLSPSSTAISIDDSGEPCSLVQFNVIGNPEVASWWSTALASMWSLDMPLDLSTSELDPATLALEDDAAKSVPLVVGSYEVTDEAEVPVVPASGSCDVLPDAPPMEGTGPLYPSDDPEAALAAFVLNAATDNGLSFSESGYVQYQLADDDIRYVFSGHSEDEAITVIDLGMVDGNWIIERWSGSAC